MKFEAVTSIPISGARRLGDVIDFRNDIVHPRDNPRGTSVFVGLEHIERDTGIRIGSERINLQEMTGRRARFYAGDIVYGYLRPYLNKVWIAEFDGICSVDQYVFTVRTGASRSYVAHFLRSAEFLQTAPISSAPGQLPRIRSGEISATPIPFPSLDEQQRIAAIMDQADALRRKRKASIKLLESLTRSIFTEMFGEMIVDTAAQLTEPFGVLAESQRIGLVRSADELADDYLIPYVRMDAIGLDGRLDLDGVKRTNASAAELAAYELKPNDFLFNTRNSKELVGKAAVFRGPRGYIYNNNILRVRFGARMLSEYAAAFFQTPFARKELEVRKSGTTSVFAIYQKSLETLPVAVPPIEAQSRFVGRIAKVRRVEQRNRNQEERLTQLFSSLQHRAFSGQL